ncbi:hypothetical protein D3C86_1564140 [compost metagenome]
MRGNNCVVKVCRTASFKDVAGNATIESFDRCLDTGGRREDYDLGSRHCLNNHLNRRHRVAGHAEINDDDVRRKLFSDFDCVYSVVALANNFEIFFVRVKTYKSFKKNRVIVHKRDGYRYADR